MAMRFAVVIAPLFGLVLPVGQSTAGAIGSIFVTEFFGGILRIDPVTGVPRPLTTQRLLSPGAIALDNLGNLRATGASVG